MQNFIDSVELREAEGNHDLCINLWNGKSILISDQLGINLPEETDWAVRLYDADNQLEDEWNNNYNKSPVHVTDTGNGPCIEIMVNDGGFIWVSNVDGDGFPEICNWCVGHHDSNGDNIKTISYFDPEHN